MACAVHAGIIAAGILCFAGFLFSVSFSGIRRMEILTVIDNSPMAEELKNIDAAPSTTASGNGKGRLSVHKFTCAMSEEHDARERMMQQSQQWLDFASPAYPETLNEESPRLERSVFGLYSVYNQVLKEVYRYFSELGLEYFPFSGTLAAHMRWGGNFGDLATPGITFITDNDVDILVRVDSEAHWVGLMANLTRFFMTPNPYRVGYYYHKCKVRTKGVKTSTRNWFMCFANATMPLQKKQPGLQAIGVDWGVVRYFVNVEQNVMYLDPVCRVAGSRSCTKSAWGMFQPWKGRVPFRGFITDDNGQLAKCPFKGSWVTCPKESVRATNEVNGGEHDRPHPHLPEYGFCIPPEIFRSGKPMNRYFRSVRFQPSPEDLAELCLKASSFSASGYQTWGAYFSKNCAAEHANAAQFDESAPVFIVVSHPHNVYQRQNIRKSWGKRMHLFFLIVDQECKSNSSACHNKSWYKEPGVFPLFGSGSRAVASTNLLGDFLESSQLLRVTVAGWFVLLDDAFFVALPALKAALQKLHTLAKDYILVASYEHSSWQQRLLIFNRRALELVSHHPHRGQQQVLVCTQQLPSSEPWSVNDCLAEMSIFTKPSHKDRCFSSEMIEFCYPNHNGRCNNTPMKQVTRSSKIRR